ncbi:hypothetical protein CORC01_02352 [Colletotrichum orchidophilum]|uniref:MutL C-terminal dimerisation domain-containing protein n=1 Tax=Colletotrichum orchidophilum TaxID=1209926 RepID=A0A1G4BLM2_9PEZI|nr:uncharacterized protein CORC01_02352 [Colletotrichum orchidophilum]OHF02359.1 hypothetical protein CORC01_02352 [Colletotrichum orchidophilum]
MSIKPLPEDVIRRIRSSATITSLNGVVCALVQNSLDAGATRINITVDYSRGNCSVEDDGLGILPLEFRENGGLVKQHHTSRFSPELECHGSNGNCLASVAALSLLSVTSHHHLHNSQNSITMHNSKVLARNIPALPEQRLVTFSHGTRVTVRDLFGSMAVRVKQRAVASEKAAVEKEWGRLVHDLTALLLAWPSIVALSVRDSVNSNETRFRPNTTSKSDMVARSSRILTQSGLLDGLDQVVWTSIGASVGKLAIEGCIALKPVATRRAQFISFGIHPVTNDHGTNILFSEVNRVFVNSGFAIEEGVEALTHSPETILSGSGGIPSKIPKPRRGLDRWPMFYFRISSSSRVRSLVTSSFEDLLEDRNRTLANMVDLLKLVCYEFLKKHHFRPHNVTTSLQGTSRSRHQEDDVRSTEGGRKGSSRSRTVSSTTSRSNSATPQRRPESPFDLWQRVKVGRVSGGTSKSGASTPLSSEVALGVATRHPAEEESYKDLMTAQPSLRFLDESGNLLRKPFDDLMPASPKRGEPAEGAYPHTSSAPVEPAELSNFCIRPSSQAEEAQLEPSPAKPDNAIHINSSPSSSQFFKPSGGREAEQPSDRLKGILSRWENPVFQPVEHPIPHLADTLGGSKQGPIQSLDLDITGCSHGAHTSSIKLSGRVSKAALMEAEVVSQVDRKFIMVKLRRDLISGGTLSGIQTNSVLVLIDQHAADERCRLESLMRDYFHVVNRPKEVVARTEMLEKPLQFEFSSKECRLLSKYFQHLRRWGIFYNIEDPEPTGWRHRSRQLPRVDVLSLPSSILERCRSEPKLLADLLRQEIWRAEEEGSSTSRPFSFATGPAGQEIDWVSNFHGCPQGILDLLNSRSCRSAIMFNDTLSRDECIALVHRLSRCSFPFQCAHGRPSMVPLVDIRSLSMKGETPLDSFGSRLKRSDLTK